MPGRLLLALDPAIIKLGAPNARSDAGFAAPPVNGLHRWDMDVLCGPPASPHANQSAEVVQSQLPTAVETTRTATMPVLSVSDPALAAAAGLQLHTTRSHERLGEWLPEILRSARELEVRRSASVHVREPMAAAGAEAQVSSTASTNISCREILMPGTFSNSTDDDNSFAETSLGKVDCSFAGLTAIPPLPLSSAKYL